MRLGFSSPLDFGIGTTIAIVAGFTMFHTQNFFVLFICLIALIFGLIRLGRVKFEITRN